MDPYDVRLECLKLATEKAPGSEVETARTWADFVLGTSDADVIRAARELADKVGGRIGGKDA